VYLEIHNRFRMILRWGLSGTRQAMVAVAMTGVLALSAVGQVTPGDNYRIVFQWQDVDLDQLGLVTDTQLIGTKVSTLSFSPFQQVANLYRVDIEDQAVGPAFYTQPLLGPSSATFAGLMTTNGQFTLTGQTGNRIDLPGEDDDGLFAGNIFLTDNTTGATSTLNVPGNFSATVSGNDFFLSAAAGIARGLGDNANSGIYRVTHSGTVPGQIDSLDLILDTGSPSGAVGGDVSGNLAFALGGGSSTINGGGFNDIYYLSSQQVQETITVSTALVGSDADRLLTQSDLLGVAGSFFSSIRPASAEPSADFLSISSLLFDQDDHLIVGLSDFFSDSNFNFHGSAGMVLKFDLVDVAGDRQAVFAEMIFSDPFGSIGSLAYRASDGMLIASTPNAAFGRDLVGIAVPEPTSMLFFGAVGLCLVVGRRHRVVFRIHRSVSHVGVMPVVLIGVAMIALAMPHRAIAELFRYGDTLVGVQLGSGVFPGFDNSDVVTGPPAVGHSLSSPQNTDPVTNSPTSLSLGQRGWVTVGFDTPVADQAASTQNPYGYDLILVGNAFQGALVSLPPDNIPARFQEPGFVEVAMTDGQGQPVEWFLILPRIFQDHVRPMAVVPRDLTPADLAPPTVGEFGVLLQEGDLGTSLSLLDGMADATPFNSAVFNEVVISGATADLVLDDPATFVVEGIGGTGIDLGRAVRQSQPGVPLLNEIGEFEFANLNAIDQIRVTDLFDNDVHHAGSGSVTTELDAVVVLPFLVPEPTSLAILITGMVVGTHRRCAG